MNEPNGSEPHMQASVEIVTPEKALAWLQNAARNRHITDPVVRRYGADMAAGRWTLNGQGIIISDEGRLLDGQHRLTAIVATGCEIPMLVVRGAKAEAFETMDSGRGRTLANVLSIEGRKNSGQVSATARLVWAYAAGTSLKYSPSRMEMLSMIRQHPLVEQYTTHIVNRDFLTKPLGVPRSALAAVLVLANETRHRDATVGEFVEGFVTGEGLFKGDPRLTLRRWLARQRQEIGVGGARLIEPFFAAAARAWSSYARQRELEIIRLPMFFSRDTVFIEGFDPLRWLDVPNLARTAQPQGPIGEGEITGDSENEAGRDQTGL